MGSRRTIGRGIGAVIGLILLAGCVPPPAGPWVGPERPVAEPLPGIRQSAGRPAVAAGGGVTLVVWGGVSGARLDGSGAVLDTGFRIATPPKASSPDVAFDGTNFLVVWEQPALREARSGIYGTRVSPAGEVLDEVPFRISTGDRAATGPALAFDGTNHLVVWTASEPGSDDIHGARVSPAGAVLDPSDLVVSASVEREREPAVAFNRGNHLVVWNSSGDILATRVTPNGVVPRPTPVPIATDPAETEAPDVTAVGDGYFAVWTNGPGNAPITGIEGSRLDATGRPLDPAGVAIDPPDPAGATTPTGARDEPFSRNQDPHIASDGTDILVTWDASSGDEVNFSISVTAARLDDHGAPVGGRFDLFLGHGSDLAFDGTNFVVAGGVGNPHDRDVGPTTLGAKRVRPGGSIVVDPYDIQISLGASSQRSLDLVSQGSGGLAVWTDDRDGPIGVLSGVYGARVSPDGRMLDGTGFKISEGLGYGPSVAFDGTNHLVVWRSWPGRVVMGARVSQAGVMLDRFAIGYPDGNRGWATFGAPAVAFGGGTFVVAWPHLNPESPLGSGAIRAARVTTDGQVLDPTAIEIPTGRPSPPDLAFGGSAFVLAWTDDGTLHRARVTPDGAVSAPSEPVATSAESAPRIAWNGSYHLVVWSGGGDVFGSRLDDTGTVLDPDPIAISTAPGEQRDPSVGANGPFLVTYTSWRREFGGADLVATRVDPDGRVVHPDGVTIATPVEYVDAAGAIAPGRAPGTFEVGYGLLHHERPHNATWASIRTVNPK